MTCFWAYVRIIRNFVRMNDRVFQNRTITSVARMQRVPAFIISLPSAAARREALTRVFSESSGLAPEFVEGVDGRTLSSAELRSSVVDRKMLWRCSRILHLSRGEIGCARSHAKCWARIVNGGFSVGLVCEDDVFFQQSFSDAIQVGRAFLEERSYPAAIMLGPRSLSNNCPVFSRSGFSLYRAYDSVSMYAYLLNRSAAETMLRSAFPLKGPVDAWFWHIRSGVRLFAMRPAPASYHNEMDASSLESDRLRQNRRIRNLVSHRRIAGRILFRLTGKRFRIALTRRFFGCRYWE